MPQFFTHVSRTCKTSSHQITKLMSTVHDNNQKAVDCTGYMTIKCQYEISGSVFVMTLSRPLSEFPAFPIFTSVFFCGAV